jgi:Na+-transporting methylmalonyl-CoA/oxaloacetate decarboxylase gamma subunit
MVRHAAFGVYTSASALQHALDKLRQAGFTKDEISVVMMKEPVHGHESGEEKGTEAAEIGAGAGALAGGILGWLAAGSILAIPGVGALFVVGSIASALVGATALGGMGALIGSFMGHGVAKETAKEYEARLKRGDTLLSVECGETDRQLQAKGILESTGAEHVHPK